MAERQIRLPHDPTTPDGKWHPRPYQAKAWNYLVEGGLRSVLCWPRRHGKDDLSLQHTACAMGERKGTYWYLLPEYSQARKSMWDAIDEEKGIKRLDAVFPPAIRTLYREQEMMLGFGGSTFQLVGADNFHSLVGSPPVGLVFSEFARTNPSAWAYLMPIIEKNGGWAIFNSTPFGDNHFKDFCDFASKEPGWFCEQLTAPGCGVYTLAQLETIRRQLCTLHGEEYGDALFNQEYMCSFDASIPGSIWGDCVLRAQKEGRIRPFAMDKALPVYTAWDLGRTDDTSIWFYQLFGGEIMIFDHHSSSLKDVQFYVDLLKEQRDRYQLTYAAHALPHDARPRTLASGAGSVLQQLQEAARRDPKLGTFKFVKRLDRQEGIQAARATFPLCHFHDTRCEKGLRSLKHYHRVWDDEKKKFVDEPEHDWASHDADSFRYLALSWKFLREPQTESSVTDQLMAANPVTQTFGYYKDKLFKRKSRLREEVAV